MSGINPQTEIRNVMLKNGLSYQWIADRLGTYYQKIQYAIEVQKEMPLSLYTDIMLLFENHGYFPNSSTLCTNLIEMSFHTNSRIGEDLKKLNDQIRENIKDGKYSPDERLKMRVRVEDYKKDFDELMNNLIALTCGEEG